MPHLNSRLRWTQLRGWEFSNFTVQLNEYETVPYFLQFSQNLTSNCLLISVYLPVFTSFCICFVFICRTILWSHHGKTGKNTEISKQSNVKFWLNWMQYEAVSSSLSCAYGREYFFALEHGPPLNRFHKIMQFFEVENGLFTQFRFRKIIVSTKRCF